MKKLHKKLLSAVLVLVLLFTCCPWVTAQDTYTITENGRAVTKLTMTKQEKRSVTADTFSEGTPQWQINVPDGDFWVDIYGETDYDLTLSYALLSSLLENGKAQVRCAAVKEGEKIACTTALQVTVQENTAVYTARKFAAAKAADPIAADPEQGLVSVTLQYVYEDSNGNPIEGFDWPDYVANMPQGDPYKTAVQIKSIPGFSPELVGSPQGVTLSADGRTVNFNLASVTESLVFTICYREVLVPYHVRRFLQNVTNDLYTEDFTYSTDVFQGYPGEQPDKDAIYREHSYPGFTALFYQPDTIAADGSTVFEIYYDRNYYLINFDLDGGFGVSPIYARYGTNISISDPEKPGHTFTGWQMTKEGDQNVAASPVVQTITGTVPSVNRTYKAIWKSGTTQYSVEYWILDDQDTADTTDDVRRFLGSSTETANSGDQVSGSDNMIQSDGKSIPLCGKVAGASHTHNDDCRISATNIKYMSFVRADQDVIVKGDGSTSVNVYYRYKSYTLKFYYARTKGGTDSDGDGVPDTGFTSVQIMGGSSHYFGTLGGNTSDDATLLKKTGSWGEITAFPTLKRNQTAYTKGIFPVNDGWDYHYLSFTARYGDDISQLWPCDVIDSATRTTANTHGQWNHSTAFVSAWNGEYRVRYTQDTTVNNGNQTIKGLYERLDQNLLFQTGRGWSDESEVSFLCFWENGASVNWSVPELYVYNIWVTCPGNDPNSAPAGATVKEHYDSTNNRTSYYYLKQSYNTCDNSTIAEQTRPGLTGYSYLDTEWGAIFISRASFNGSTYSGTGDGKYHTGSQQVQSSDWYVSQSMTATRQSDGTYLLTSKEYDDGKYGADVNPDVYREAYYRDFYYNSVNPRLFYKNQGSNMGDGTGAEVPYGKSLVVYGQYFTKETMETQFYPSTLESNAYTFGGWYISNSFHPDTIMNWNSTMPDSNMTVYAYWEPKTYNVRFYEDYEDYLARTEDDEDLWYSKENIAHGEQMKDLDHNKVKPTRENYSFIRWIYEDDAGNKHSFEPTQMAVRQNLDLYAEWRTTAVSEYTVQYIKGKEENGNIVPERDENGDFIYLATDTTGYAVVGTTKTVPAKPVNQLDKLSATDKTQLWLPQTSSHSILMKEDKTQNVFQFIYITKPAAKYTVHYRDEETGQPVHPSLLDQETTLAEETVWFQYVEGYVPDALYKRLVLSADNNNNVVIFYYSKEKPNEALYQVTHYLQNPDGTDYEVYKTDGYTAVVGTQVEASPITIAGAHFDHSEPAATKVGSQYVVRGTVTKGDNNDALELKLYYRRDQVQYTVQFKNQDDDKDPNMPASITKTGYVGQTVSADAVILADYDLISASTQKLTLSTNETMNVITFWYRHKEVNIRYIVKSTVDGLTHVGAVSRSEDSGTQINGSTALPLSSGYFMGWYRDEDCQELVTTDVTLMPQRQANVYDYTYYALFAPYRLTISQTGMAKDGHSAVYEILKGTDVVTRVMVSGNRSVTVVQLKPDTYTVREVTGNWTWTYGTTQTKTVTVTEGSNEVSFQYTYEKPCWLQGETKK